MPKMRSPNYPAIGLGLAVEALRVIWTKEQRTPITAEVAAKHMGYSSLNGIARMKLSALKKFGLLEEGNSGWKVSDLGLRILHHKEDSEDYLRAVRDAALRSELFRKLVTTHAQASDDALKSHLLLNESFSEAGSREFIKAFRNTVAVAKMDTGNYTPPDSGDRREGDMQPEEQDRAKNQQFMDLMLPKGPATGEGRSGGGNLWFKVPFGATELTVRIEVRGDQLRREHVAKIRKYLELTESDLATPSEKDGAS